MQTNHHRAYHLATFCRSARQQSSQRRIGNVSVVQYEKENLGRVLSMAEFEPRVMFQKWKFQEPREKDVTIRNCGYWFSKRFWPEHKGFYELVLWSFEGNWLVGDSSVSGHSRSVRPSNALHTAACAFPFALGFSRFEFFWDSV